MRVLAVNAGSSSLKLSLLAPAEGCTGEDNTIEALQIDAPGGEIDREHLRDALASPLGRADAIGHRIVHGGEHFRGAVEIDTDVEAQLRELVDLAPLHQPKSLAAFDAVSECLPGIPAVACFDTAFHATIPADAATYALPAQWRERYDLRRYGFHGLSHAWVARRAPEVLGLPAGSASGRRGERGSKHERTSEGEREHGLASERHTGALRPTHRPRIVSCHLGAGASLCAIGDGVSLDTTMGFTPLEGLPMATRSGSVDPGLLLWLLERTELSASEMSSALEYRSGLLGLGGSADMREILARSDEGDERASLALDVYTHRLCAGVAAMAAALGGLDVLAFTGGVGERSAEVRARACAGTAFLGVGLDESRNRGQENRAEPPCDMEIGAEGAPVRTAVLAAREDIEIAREVRTLLERS